MGSFTELVLAFTFASETPPEALSAFAPWQTGENAPSLPLLDESLSADEQMEIEEGVEMELLDADDLAAAFRAVPLLHRAVAWHALLRWSANAYFPGTPSTALHWKQRENCWSLTTRTLPKMDSEMVRAVVAPLGEFATDGSPDRPRFVGYINDEDPGPPILVFSQGSAPFQFRTT